jgi:branched-chain amino acid transport system substrate-binding protein
LRDALYATQDFPGITGKITCDPSGDCSDTRFHVMRLDDPAVGIDGLIKNTVFESK